VEVRERLEKILRIQERAERLQVPLVYLVDSAGDDRVPPLPRDE
jgi:acetyl-CoA carboxylase carboxyltransferase component